MRCPSASSGFFLAVVFGFMLATLACSADATLVTPPVTELGITPTPFAEATPVRTATAVPTPTPRPTASPSPPPAVSPTPEATAVIDVPLVILGDAVYLVDLALTGEERGQGLSGRPNLGTDQGMLFVYDDDAPRAFWMPNMHFPLDMVWINSECTVSGVTSNVPNPPLETPRNELPRYPSGDPVRFVLEINAGQAALTGISFGTSVEFGGEITGRWGC